MQVDGSHRQNTCRSHSSTKTCHMWCGCVIFFYEEGLHPQKVWLRQSSLQSFHSWWFQANFTHYGLQLHFKSTCKRKLHRREIKNIKKKSDLRHPIHTLASSNARWSGRKRESDAHIPSETQESRPSRTLDHEHVQSTSFTEKLYLKSVLDIRVKLWLQSHFPSKALENTFHSQRYKQN